MIRRPSARSPRRGCITTTLGRSLAARRQPAHRPPDVGLLARTAGGIVHRDCDESWRRDPVARSNTTLSAPSGRRYEGSRAFRFAGQRAREVYRSMRLGRKKPRRVLHGAFVRGKARGRRRAEPLPHRADFAHKGAFIGIAMGRRGLARWLFENLASFGKRLPHAHRSFHAPAFSPRSPKGLRQPHATVTTSTPTMSMSSLERRPGVGWVWHDMTTA